MESASTEFWRGIPSKMRRGLVVPQARPTLTLELVLRHHPRPLQFAIQ